MKVFLKKGRERNPYSGRQMTEAERVCGQENYLSLNYHYSRIYHRMNSLFCANIKLCYCWPQGFSITLTERLLKTICGVVLLNLYLIYIISVISC